MTLRIARAASAFLFLFLFHAVGFAQPAEWNELLRKAERSERQFEYDQANKYLTRALEAARQAQAGVDDLTNILDRLGDSQLRFSLSFSGKPEQYYREALDLRMRQFGPDHDTVGVSLQRLGKLALGRGEHDDAHDYLSRSLEIQRKALGEVHIDVVNLYLDIGEVYLAENREKEARDSFEQAVRLREQAVGSEGEEIADLLEEIEKRYGFRFPKVAERYRERALEHRERVLAEDNPRFLTALLALVKHYSYPAEYERAEALLARARDIVDRHFQPDSSQAALLYASQGSLFHQQKRLDQAEESYRRAVAIGESSADARGRLASDLESLADVLDAQKRTEEACALYRRSMDTLLANTPLHDADLPPSLFRLAHAHLIQKDLAQAEYIYRVLYTIQINADGPFSLSLAHVLEETGDTNVAWKRWQTASANYERVLAIREKEWEATDPRLASDLTRLARVYRELGRHGEAEGLEKRATRVQFLFLVSIFQELGTKVLKYRFGGWPVWSLLAVSLGCGIVALTWFLLAQKTRPVPFTAVTEAEPGPPPIAEPPLAPDPAVRASYEAELAQQPLTTFGLAAGTMPAAAEAHSPPAQREFSFRAGAATSSAFGS